VAFSRLSSAATSRPVISGIFKETMENPHDWDLCLAVQYKNHAAMDGLDAKEEAIRDKVLGGKQPAQQVGEKRVEMREIVSSTLLQEVMLK
jgi:hypothetical protein